MTACARLGFTVERTRGEGGFAIEFGPGALVDSLPGVSAGSTWVGTFDREEAVEDEGLDFFASGHPLVEGVFAHFEDSPLGRVARFTVEIDAQTGQGLVAIYKDGPRFDVVALDSEWHRPAGLGSGPAPTAAPRPPRVGPSRRRPGVASRNPTARGSTGPGATPARGSGHRRAADAGRTDTPLAHMSPHMKCSGWRFLSTPACAAKARRDYVRRQVPTPTPFTASPLFGDAKPDCRGSPGASRSLLVSLCAMWRRVALSLDRPLRPCRLSHRRAAARAVPVVGYDEKEHR